MTSLLDRYYGAILGLAAGDALGVTLEFQQPGSFTPISDIVGGGPFAQPLPAGAWTDDTSMALCLAESLFTRMAFDPLDQMERYWRWYNQGHLSSTGKCFDIGSTVRKALRLYRKTGEPFCGSTDPKTAGNGSLMRLAPIPLMFAGTFHKAISSAGKSSKTTHAAEEAIHSCMYYSSLITGALSGFSKSTLLDPDFILFPKCWDQFPLTPNVERIRKGSYKMKNPPEIRGSGYVIESMEAALWAFHNSESFRDGALLAVNLGDDADTTGAVFGQLAGAHYGIANIPVNWLNVLSRKDLLKSYTENLLIARFLYDTDKKQTVYPEVQDALSQIPERVLTFIQQRSLVKGLPIPAKLTLIQLISMKPTKSGHKILNILKRDNSGTVSQAAHEINFGSQI